VTTCAKTIVTPPPTIPTNLSPKDLLYPRQRAFVDNPAQHIIGVTTRQWGKSTVTAGKAVHGCLTDPGSTWVCMSAGERQSLEWQSKAKEWYEAYRLAVHDVAEDRGGLAEGLLKSSEILFNNGSRIVAIPANPSTARGYSANIILDEFAYHEDPDAIWAAMFPSTTNQLAGTFLTRWRAMLKGESVDIRRKLKVIVVSTFNGKDNKFFRLWERAKENGYSQHLVTIHDAVADGMPLDADKLKAALDDPDTWAQEFECVPTDTSNVLLPYDLISLAESADACEVIGPEFFEMGVRNPVYCGIDFGRQNDPTVCWTLEQIGDILWTREVLVLREMSSPDQREILRSRIKRASRVSFDYTGPGVGLGDELVKAFGEFDPTKHQFGKVELFVFTQKSKQELFPKLRRKFESPVKLRIPISRVVREDLHAMQQVVSNGTYNYWAPHTRDGHSDRCTALALAVHAAGESKGPFAHATRESLSTAARRETFAMNRRLA
jgi:phage FluMu gp28-like protein